jgi:hypothetical protein
MSKNRNATAPMGLVPENIAVDMLTKITVRAICFREHNGRDAAVLAGCVDDLVSLAGMLGYAFDAAGLAAITDEILGRDDTDDVLAGILAVPGLVQHAYSWPASHIDWSAAASALRMDYSQVEYDGVTYWYR